MKNNNRGVLENSVSASPHSPHPPPASLPRPRRAATHEMWMMIRADYVAGKGSLRSLAQEYRLSASTVMKRSMREHWEAKRTLTSSNTEAMVEASLQQRAEAFVKRVADQTDTLITKIQESGDLVQPEDRSGLRQLAATLKDVNAVGRETYQLGNREDGARCIVNLGFLGSFAEDPLLAADPASLTLEPGQVKT